VAIREQIGGRAVDELVATLGDLREPARDHALAVDVAADRDLLEEDVLDPLALDLGVDLGDPLAAPRGGARLGKRLRRGIDTRRLEHALHRIQRGFLCSH
jgi:hypothetical protein